MTTYARYADAHADEVQALLAACGWSGRALPSAEVLSEASEIGCAFIAIDDDGAIVGFVRAVSDYDIVTYVTEIAVLADARLKGVGRTLLEMVIAEYPAARVDLLSTEDAQGFYAELGFVPKPGFRRWPA